MRNLLIIVFAGVLSACGPDDPGLGSNPIDSKIHIETRELLGPEARHLTFCGRTEKIYPCINYPILTDVGTTENSFSITFKSVGDVTLCATALGPASTSVDLNTVPNGTYTIELNNANLKNTGTLTITDTDINLVFARENGIEIVRANTKRVPANTYWGTIGYHTQSSSGLVTEFLQELSGKGAVFGKQAPGHYYHYEIDDAGDIVADAENSGYYFLKAFIFQYDGDVSALKDLVQDGWQPHKDDLSINMTTFTGEQVNNWSK